MEVCRKFKRGTCNRRDCKYAHPPSHLRPSAQGTVTICFDFINGKCNREKLREPCRYYHPEPHQIKELENRRRLGSGRKRNHEFPLLMNDGRPFDMSPRLRSDRRLFDRPPRVIDDRMPKRAKIHRINEDSRSRQDLFDRPFEPPPLMDNPMLQMSSLSPKRSRNSIDRNSIEVCRDFENSRCERKNCLFAHPPRHIIPTPQGTVTVCFDFVRGRCDPHRKKPCRYYHPEPHQIEEILIRRSRSGETRQQVMRREEQYIPRKERDYFRSRDLADMYDRKRYHKIHDMEHINPPRRNQPILDRHKLANIPKQIEVCRNYEKRNTCKFSDCKYAHAPKWVRIKDGMVTICMDYLRGVCNRDHLREPCRYFHAPPHIIQPKISHKIRSLDKTMEKKKMFEL